MLDFVDLEAQAMLPVVTAGDVAAILNGAKVGGGFVSVVVAWKLLGRLQAWTLSGASLLDGNGEQNQKDKCPADAPKGEDAVGSRTPFSDELLKTNA